MQLGFVSLQTKCYCSNYFLIKPNNKWHLGINHTVLNPLWYSVASRLNTQFIGYCLFRRVELKDYSIWPTDIHDRLTPNNDWKVKSK